jgi:fructokinase
MGLVALDIVFTADDDTPPRSYAGGTCGNVLTILSYLGWSSIPVSRLRNDKASKRLLEDLHQWGVSTKFVSQTPDGSTPVIVQRIKRSSNGVPRHSFSWRCPSCGAYLPGYKPVLAAQIEAAALSVPKGEVFFFDRVSRATLLMAAISRKRGAVVCFEPASVGDPALFKEAWAVSHVVKYSHERLSEMAELGLGHAKYGNVLLEIETIGAEGLRYRSWLPAAATKSWVSVEPFSVPDVKDTSGAGDWFTAGVLNSLARKGAAGLAKSTRIQLRTAVENGQALAAWNCRFEGARRGMYEVSRSELESAVKQILGRSAGAVVEASESSGKAHEDVAELCHSCVEQTSAVKKQGRGQP